LRHATKHSFSRAWASILADRQEVHIGYARPERIKA
jgi:hypothetical protein